MTPQQMIYTTPKALRLIADRLEKRYQTAPVGTQVPSEILDMNDDIKVVLVIDQDRINRGH